LRELVRTQLLELLSTGDLAPGTDLSEARLSEALGVSRSPLREALLLLSHEGYIENIPNRGFFVPVPDPARVADIYTVLSELECMAMALSWLRLRDVIDELEDLNRQIIAPGKTPQERGAADRALHKALAGSSPNQVLNEEIERLWISGRLHDGASQRGLANPGGSAAQHQEILDALRADDCPEAVKRLRHHWDTGIDVVETWIRGSGAKG